MMLHGHVDEISRSVVEGWAIDIERPEEAVSVSILVNGSHRGMCVTTHGRTDLVLPNGETVAGKCGFYLTFDPPLSPFAEQRIEVIETWSTEMLPNGSRILPRPHPHGGDDGTGITPILLTSTGRAGTTLLMSEFARHTAVVVGDQYPYEIKQIAYHAAAFRALAADAGWERSTTPNTMLAPEMQRIIGSNPYNMAGLFALGGGGGALRDFYQSTVPSGFATLFRRFIVEFYTRLAEAQGKSSAPYFCEKGAIDEAAVHGARLFFGAVKDIVIVRDPRDLLCSAIAFWKLRPDQAMNMLTTTIPRLARIARFSGSDTVAIRYEDLVRQPVATRRALSHFLDLDLVRWPTDKADQVPDSHRTSSDPAASIGRWRRDLTAEQVDACESAFGTFMREFDYTPGDGQDRRQRSASPHPAAAKSPILAAEGALAVADFNENSDAGPPRPQVLELLFGRGESGEASTREGWSQPERGFVWSNATECRLHLPPIRREGKYWLHITASPFTHGNELPAQRVTVKIDSRTVGSAQVRDTCVLRIPLPATASRSGQGVTLTLRFPDARRPSEIFGGDDHRLLGFSLHRIALFQLDTARETADPGQKRPGRRPSARSSPNDLLARQNGEHEGVRNSLVTRVLTLAREVFKQPTLAYSTSALSRHIPGYDATNFVQLILALESAFGVALHEDEVDAITTMDDIVTLLAGKIPDSSGPITRPSRSGRPARDRSDALGKRHAVVGGPGQ